jgi:hypothetical protein
MSALATSSRAPVFPAFANDTRSKKLAVRVRRTYRTIIRIIECTKARKVRKVSLLCSQLTNSKVLEYLPHTKMFADLASYHVSTGKFRKNSYRVLLKIAPTPLAELERRIRESDFLCSIKPTQSVVAKSVLIKSKKSGAVSRKPLLSFNALEDLDKIKQLLSKSQESTENIIKKHQQKQKAESSIDGEKQFGKRTKTTVVDLDAEEDLAKSVTEDDALVFNTINRERKDVDLDIGECTLLKRSVVMLGTHIPGVVWKKVFAHLGLQIVAKQYIVAMYAPVIAAPAEEDGETLDSAVVLNHAAQYVALYNRKQKDDTTKLVLVGKPLQLNNATHWWYLTLPACVANHASFRIKSWEFTKPPRTRTAFQAQAIE